MNEVVDRGGEYAVPSSASDNCTPCGLHRLNFYKQMASRGGRTSTPLLCVFFFVCVCVCVCVFFRPSCSWPQSTPFRMKWVHQRGSPMSLIVVVDYPSSPCPARPSSKIIILPRGVQVSVQQTPRVPFL
ncbi:unnamed protein product [Pylaiella littoralis]